MLKLCVICFYIGKPYNAGSVLDYVTYGPLTGGLLKEMHSNLCPQCDNRNCMIPIDSFRAQKLIEDFRIALPENNPEESQTEKFVWEKNEPEE